MSNFVKMLLPARTTYVPVSFKMQNEIFLITADLSFEFILTFEKFVVYNALF